MGRRELSLDLQADITVQDHVLTIGVATRITGPKRMELDSMQQRHNEHTSLSWTACHDDACYIHLSDKEGSGWLPRIPRSAAKRQRELHKQRELEAEIAADQAGKGQIPW